MGESEAAEVSACGDTSGCEQAAVRAKARVERTRNVMMIVAEGLKKSYTSGGRPLPVLQSLDLSIEADSFVSIVGPSGSGKTTLLGLLAGLDEPTSGRVLLDGEDIFSFSEDGRAAFRAERVGFVFQTFHLLPTLTALENVLVPLELRGEGNEARGSAVSLLERVGLGGRLDHFPSQLSGGEQQRVALARAFSNRPKILFADEPTGNLDYDTSNNVFDYLMKYSQNKSCAIVMATHNLSLASLANKKLEIGTKN